MPKHYIYPQPNPDGTNAESRLELHWQRDNGVQITTTKWAGLAGKVDHDVTYLAEALGTAITTSTAEVPLAWQGQAVELTRDQINHLIRELRIARDQAYGKNE